MRPSPWRIKASKPTLKAVYMHWLADASVLLSSISQAPGQRLQNEPARAISQVIVQVDPKR